MKSFSSEATGKQPFPNSLQLQSTQVSRMKNDDDISMQLNESLDHTGQNKDRVAKTGLVNLKDSFMKTRLSQTRHVKLDI